MAPTTDRSSVSAECAGPDDATLARRWAAAVELSGASLRSAPRPAADGRLLAPLALVLLLGGCEHDRYADRRDQVTFGTGDAVAANKAMHIIDPWPRAARTIEHGMSGEQAEAALDRLRKRNAAAPAAGPASTITIPVAPAAPKL